MAQVRVAILPFNSPGCACMKGKETEMTVPYMVSINGDRDSG